jgi:hypothetical protein
MFGSNPSSTFSSTVRAGTSAISCAIVAIPALSASRGERNVTRWSFSSKSPVSGW